MIQLTIDTDQLMHNVHFGSVMLGPKNVACLMLVFLNRFNLLSEKTNLFDQDSTFFLFYSLTKLKCKWTWQFGLLRGTT